MYQESKYLIVTKGSKENTSSYILDRVLNILPSQNMPAPECTRILYISDLIRNTLHHMDA